MDIALKKLAKEIDWTPQSAFKDVKIIGFKRNKTKSQGTIKLSAPAILPVEQLSSFYTQLGAKFGKICHLKKHQIVIQTQNQNWDLPVLQNYVDFISEKILHFDHHLMSFLSMAKLKLIQDVEVAFELPTLQICQQFIPYQKDLSKHLQNCGFPQLIIKFTELTVSKDLLEKASTLIETENKSFVSQKEKTQKINIPYISKSKDAVLEIKDARLQHQQTYLSSAVIQGKIVKVEKPNRTRSGMTINQFILLDKTDAIFCKFFVGAGRKSSIDPTFLKAGNYVKVKGSLKEDTFAKEIILIAKTVELIDFSSFAIRKEHTEKPRIELCAKTQMSALDGLNKNQDLVDRAHQWNQPAIGITDIDNVQAFPDLYNYSKKFPNLKILYGATIKTLSKKTPLVSQASKNFIKNAEYVVFDLETTGLSANVNKIIEFGGVKIKDGTIIDHLQFFVNIHQPLSVFTKKLTGITDEDIAKGYSLEEGIDKILAFFSKAVLVAHNANFDMSFINSALITLKKPALKNLVIDTLQVAKYLLNQKSFNLMRVCKSYGIFYDATIAHRADYDAEVLAKVFLKMITDLQKNNLETFKDLKNVLSPNLYAKSFPKNVTILAKNKAGLKKLFQIISQAHTQNFFKKPIIFEEDLWKDRQNLLIGSSENDNLIWNTALNKSTKELEKAIQKFDFVEVQPPSNFLHLINRQILTKHQIEIILKKIILTAKKMNVLVVVTTHPRYLDPEQKEFHQIYIHTKGLGGVRHPLYRHREENSVYPDLYLKTTKDLQQEFAFLNDKSLIQEIVVENTYRVVEQIEKIEIIKDGLFTPKIDGVEDKLFKKIYQRAHQKYGKKLPKIISDRLKKEWHSISTYQFGVIYWIAYKLVKKSLQDGYLVGSRGSVGSSLIATLLEITEVNPLSPHYYCSNCEIVEFENQSGLTCGYDLPSRKCSGCNKLFKQDGHSIPFETFLGFEGDKVPDIDLNFSGEYQNIIHQEVKKMFGDQHAFRAGTISTVATRTAFGYVKSYIQEMDLDISRAYIDYLINGIEGNKRTTGQHPGGIIVVPKDLQIEDFTPINYPANDIHASWKTTHFDFHAIHDNLLKLDLLGHDDPTAIRMLEDLTKVKVSAIPNSSSEVIALFNSPEPLGLKSGDIFNETTGALGIPEFGTEFVRNMLKGVKIQKFADLVAISGLSHGTDVWTNNAQKYLKEKKLQLSDIISCRDDIMVYLISLGIEEKLSFQIMEQVRKGKGLNEEQIAIMKKHKVPQWYIESCLKIKYIFPKAHATAYVKMAWRIAWYKIKYPLEYYATFFTTRSDSLEVFTMTKGKNNVESRLKELLERRYKKNIEKLTLREQALIMPLLLAQEMLARGFYFANVDLYKSNAKNWIIDYKNKKLVPPLIAVDNLGITVANSIVKAREEKKFASIEDLQKRTQLNNSLVKLFQQENIIRNLAKKNQISFELVF